MENFRRLPKVFSLSHWTLLSDLIQIEWIEEKGASFRLDLPLLLYYCWCEKKFIDEVNFSDNVVPLVPSSELQRIQEQCESIYLDTLIERFKITRVKRLELTPKCLSQVILLSRKIVESLAYPFDGQKHLFKMKQLFIKIFPRYSQALPLRSQRAPLRQEQGRRGHEARSRLHHRANDLWR